MADLSKDALDALVTTMTRLADDMEKHATDEWDEHENVSAAIATITALRAELKIAHAALDEEERAHGISTNGNMWRFWANEARELSAENARLTAALDKVSDDLMRADMQRITAEARITKLERDVQAAEAAALERAIAHFEIDEWDGDATTSHCEYAQHELRSLAITAAFEGTTALDAVRADARRAGMVDGLREAARLSVSFLVGDPANEIPLRNPMPHQIKDYILARAEQIERGEG